MWEKEYLNLSVLNLSNEDISAHLIGLLWGLKWRKLNEVKSVRILSKSQFKHVNYYFMCIYGEWVVYLLGKFL